MGYRIGNLQTVKRILVLILLGLNAFPAHAGNIKCGADTTGSGVLNQINDCTAGTPFAYGGVTPTGVANTNLCPINQANCSMRQYRCDADVAKSANFAPVYSDTTSCQNGCNWTDTCTSTPFTKTLSGLGKGTICTDADMTIAVQDVGGGTRFRLAMLDTSPSGGAHANCEPPTVNDGGTYTMYNPPIMGGWHIINHPGTAADPQVGVDIDFTPYLPASNGWDAWNAQVKFCASMIDPWDCGGFTGVTCTCDTNGDGTNDRRCEKEQCVYAAGVAATFPYRWDPDPGSRTWEYLYTYSITIANNAYTCPLDATAQCTGTVGTADFSPQYYRVTTPCPGPYCTAWGSCSGLCPSSGYSDVAAAPAGAIYVGKEYAGPNWHNFYLNTTPTPNPSSTKTCSKVGTCNAEPVCPVGYGCDCTNGTAPTCQDNGTFAPSADQCQLTGASLTPAGFTYSAAAHGAVKDPFCEAGTFSATSNVCEATKPITCTDPLYGYKITSQKCEYTMSCLEQTSWDNILSKCRTASRICDAGYGYGTAAGLCDTPSTGPDGTALNTTRDKYEVAPTFTCDPNDPLTGQTCTKTTTSTSTYAARAPCDAGDTLSNGTCTHTTTTTSTYAASCTTTYSCPTSQAPPSGVTIVLSGGTCYPQGSYSRSGSYLPCSFANYGVNCWEYSATQCQYYSSGYKTFTKKWVWGPCNAFTNDYGWGGTCYTGLSGSEWAATGNTSCTCNGSDPRSGTTCTGTTTTTTTYAARPPCDAGDTLSNGTCTHTTTSTYTYAATPHCQTGTTYNSAIPICQADPICDKPGSAYNTSIDLCTKSANGTPPTGTTYDSATGYAVYSPKCSSSGAQTGLLCQLDPTLDCGGMAPGPVNGSNITCQSVARCDSPSALDTTIHQCKIPGGDLCPTAWGWDQPNDNCTHVPTCTGSTYDAANKKCCACKSSNACITTVANPTVSEFSCSPNQCVDTATSVSTTSDLTFLQNDIGFNTQDGSCAGSVYIFGGQPRTCRPQGFDTAGQDCCSNPAASVGGIIGGVCAEDYPAKMPGISRLCHYVGDYCSNSWPIAGCVQMTKSYCCWDSVLSRIINEQGRLQLKRFNQFYCPNWPNGTCPPAGIDPQADTSYWNTPLVPDCSGLKPEELQMLDWSKIDLGEYFTDLQNQVNQQIPALQNGIQQNITDFYNQLK
ncbi:MAG: conjugal transfer protein TraN [Nitrospinae bacterium]|nr:conjugal transfer protein TraN [Nitrospinota bacterium]